MSLIASTSSTGADIIKIYLTDGSYSSLKYDSSTTVEKIIRVVVDQFSAGNALDSRHYALRVVGDQKKSLESDVYWLCRDWSMKRVSTEFPPLATLRFELRIRYLGENLEDMLRNQTASFYYFYDQVRKQYVLSALPVLQLDVAIELGSLEIRRFLKDMSLSTFEKKSNFEFLTREVGLDKFFSTDILALHKPKTLRKIIQAHFKKYASFSESDCVLQFFALLSEYVRYKDESFKCFLGSNWAVPIGLIIGPESGVSYLTDSKCRPIKLVNFIDVQSIRTNLVSGDALKATVALQVVATPEPLVISCSCSSTAHSIAHLIDGYRSLLSPDGSHSVWVRQAWPFKYSFDGLDEEVDADYAAPASSNFDLDREKITMQELLGEGQFGDVYKGQYELPTGAKMPVAVKACKVESEECRGGNFLEEAYVMQQFDHPHIVKLIGVCSTSPIWIVMELAALGELRAYLIEHRRTLSLIVLISFCYQLSSALSYLESRNFVHRDIAARNMLVFGPEEVKLSDFGLSRQVEDHSFYTASRGKLPIKWMAPESINFRRFTQASDVWMFGVAAWEILSLGVKPFQGIRNHDVIHRIERGERLPLPANCPKELYDVMLDMWAYEPCTRPKMADVKIALYELLSRYKNGQSCSSFVSSEGAVVKNGDAVTLRQPTDKFAGKVEKVDFFPSRCPKIAKELNSCVFNSLDRNRNAQHANLYTRCWTGTLNAPVRELKRRTSVSSIDMQSIEKILVMQKRQSEEDSEWLKSEEVKMQLANVKADPPEAGVRSRGLRSKPTAVVGPPPGTELCRKNDKIYDAILSIVKAINVMTKSVPHSCPERYVDFVKDIGLELKSLLLLSNSLAQTLPTDSYSEVSMAEKVLSSCMQKLVGAMRLTIQNAQTTLHSEFRLQMLAEAHVLAVECKNFLQAVDSSRIKANLAQFVAKLDQPILRN